MGEIEVNVIVSKMNNEYTLIKSIKISPPEK